MELKEFIKETLVQIIDGIKEAQNSIGADNGEIIPKLSTPKDKYEVSSEGRIIHNIYFDVAVTATEGSEKKGGGGIKVASLIEIGGEGKRSESNVSQNQIQFHVPLTYPYSQK